jgi:hypothetical protein
MGKRIIVLAPLAVACPKAPSAVARSPKGKKVKERLFYEFCFCLKIECCLLFI